MCENNILNESNEIINNNNYEDFDDDQNISLLNLNKNEILRNYFPEEKWHKASNC
jgi:hypothetical protein